MEKAERVIYDQWVLDTFGVEPSTYLAYPAPPAAAVPTLLAPRTNVFF